MICCSRRSSRDRRLIRQRRSTDPAVEGATPVSAASRTAPQRLRSRSDTIRFVVAGPVLAGLERGRLERSAIPAAPSVRYRSAHRSAVVQATPKYSAARLLGQFCSTTNWARRRRWRGVRAALAWSTRTSGCVSWSPSAAPLHVRRSPLTRPVLQISRSHVLDQRLWSVQLDGGAGEADLHRRDAGREGLEH